jgi:hypothetical protein
MSNMIFSVYGIVTYSDGSSEPFSAQFDTVAPSTYDCLATGEDTNPSLKPFQRLYDGKTANVDTTTDLAAESQAITRFTKTVNTPAKTVTDFVLNISGRLVYEEDGWTQEFGAQWNYNAGAYELVPALGDSATGYYNAVGTPVPLRAILQAVWEVLVGSGKVSQLTGA